MFGLQSTSNFDTEQKIFAVQHLKCAYHLYQLTSQNYAVLSYVFNSIPMPESYQYIRNLERLGAKIQHNTCIFLVSYRTKIPGTMNTLDLMWFIPSVISNIESRTYSYLPAHFMFTSPIFIQGFFLGGGGSFCFGFFFLDFYTVLQ